MIKLCAQCSFPGTTPTKAECEWCQVTPAMQQAWVAYEPPDGFDFDGGYNEGVALIRHAFLHGYLAAQGTEAGTAETGDTDSVHDGPGAESDAPKGQRP